MKFKGQFALRNMGDFSAVVAVGECVKDYNCMITLNQSGTILWQALQNGENEKDLIKTLLNEYDVSEEIAKKDVEEFLNTLKKANIIEWFINFRYNKTLGKF